MNREERERTQGKWKRPKRPAFAVGQWWSDGGRTYCISAIDMESGRVYFPLNNGSHLLFFYLYEGLPSHWTIVGKW